MIINASKESIRAQIAFLFMSLAIFNSFLILHYLGTTRTEHLLHVNPKKSCMFGPLGSSSHHVNSPNTPLLNHSAPVKGEHTRMEMG